MKLLVYPLDAILYFITLIYINIYFNQLNILQWLKYKYATNKKSNGLYVLLLDRIYNYQY